MTEHRAAALPGARSPKIVLASRSPQRRAILEQLGVRFRVEVPDVDEVEHGDPERIAVENARRKAHAVDGELILAVDTVVALEGRSYAKPRDQREATEFLRTLSGRRHDVLGGLCVRTRSSERISCARTAVCFRALSAREIRWYVDSGEWRERAGGYAIQGKGAALVERIEGDYWNVVGLPVPELLRLCPELLVRERT